MGSEGEGRAPGRHGVQIKTGGKCLLNLGRVLGDGNERPRT